ncbi:LacI family DNA-binding transcriptional regulator [bacterium]|nr:LacI family DNA-binding transcriptional regulator [bacterium]
MSVTLQQIADMAGVSRVTVSRVLNNRPGVGESTKQRILALAEQYDYIPNRAPNGLRRLSRDIQQQSFTFRFVYAKQRSAKQSVEPIFSGVLEALGRYLHERQQHFLLHPLMEENHIDTHTAWLTNEAPDGIFAFCCEREDLPFLETAQHMGIPLVLINPQIYVPQTIQVTMDNAMGARQAMAHLIKTGHKYIAHIGGKQGDWDAIERKQTYLAMMQEHGLRIRKDYIRMGEDWCFQTGIEGMKALCKSKTPPTAVFAADDTIAAGAITYCLQHNINVPNDMAIIGFDDMLSERHFTPALTSIHYDYQSMGMVAARELLHALRDGYISKRIALPTSLIKRQST